MKAKGYFDSVVADFETVLIVKELKVNNWNITKTAESLGLSFRALRYKIAQLDIKKEN